MVRMCDLDALRADVEALNIIMIGRRAGKGALKECLMQYRDAVLKKIDEQPTIFPVTQEWISTEDRMPEEHDSIFARFYGTDKWSPAMFRTTSYDVIVCLKYEDGKRGVKVSRTQDGKWNINTLIQSKVTHWMPLPGALMED